MSISSRQNLVPKPTNIRRQDFALTVTLEQGQVLGIIKSPIRLLKDFGYVPRVHKLKMKTLFNSTYAKGCVNLCSERNIVGTMSEVDEVPFSVELVGVGAKHSFYKILLEAIDDADPVADKKRTANSQKEVSKNDLQTL